MLDRARPQTSFLARRACLAAVSALLVSCSAYREAKQGIQQDTKSAEKLANIADHAKGPTGPGNVRVENSVWLGDIAVKNQRGEPLPSRFEKPKAMTLISAKPLTVAEIAAYVTQATGIEITGAAEIGRDSDEPRMLARFGRTARGAHRRRDAPPDHGVAP